MKCKMQGNRKYCKALVFWHSGDIHHTQCNARQWNAKSNAKYIARYCSIMQNAMQHKTLLFWQGNQDQCGCIYTHHMHTNLTQQYNAQCNGRRDRGRMQHEVHFYWKLEFVEGRGCGGILELPTTRQKFEEHVAGGEINRSSFSEHIFYAFSCASSPHKKKSEDIHGQSYDQD